MTPSTRYRAVKKSIPSAFIPAASVLMLIAPNALAALSSYTVEQLLKPCVEGDNDSRWGATAEAECEQYIKGFTDAYVLLTDGGRNDNVCLPDQNRLDEVRWAFMRWAHKNFGDRGMPAAEGLLAVIQERFGCQ